MEIYRAGSHLPILKTLLKGSISSCLEIGSGLISSPLLYTVKRFVSVETDPEWYRIVSEKLPARDGFDYLLWDMKTKASEYANSQLAEYWSFDLLFVDNNPANTRKRFLRELYSHFPVTVWHDAQNTGYWKWLSTVDKTKYSHLVLSYGRSGQMKIPSTGMLTSRTISKDFVQQLETEADQFCRQNAIKGNKVDIIWN